MLKSPIFPSPSAVAEYEEQVASFFRRSNSKAEGEAALLSHSASLLAQLGDLLPTIRECPAYAGIAFYGRLQAVDIKLIRRLMADGVASPVAIEALRAGKALRVSAAAKAGWDLLKSADPDALWTAILLNLVRSAAPSESRSMGSEPEESEDENGDDEQNEHDQQNEDDDN